MGESEEAGNIVEARKRLNEATQLIKLKIKSGHLVLKQNIWYGFVRNLIGGAIYSMFFCVINMVVGSKYDKPTLIISSLVLFIVYAGVFTFYKQILIQNAEAYANQLIGEFISMDSTIRDE